MLKKILIGLAVVIAIPLIAAIFVKKDYSVEREILINKPKEVVFDYIKHLKNQDNFSKWALMDPDMKKTYEGTDGTVGFVAAWESDNDDVGKGAQEILKIAEGNRVDYELRFFEPFESTALAYMTTEEIDANNTKVSWGFSGSMDYPMNLMMVFMDMEKMIGDDFDEGLKNLKEELE
ncbi:SRPBCC family protein [Sediminicola sp. 1XM1-17]|uniref:SRPBCC family protein n=1 Tax=Sediminicola sp. 1XM1-17 TaxID=3127702 RepID=UPI00307760A4